MIKVWLFRAAIHIGALFSWRGKKPTALDIRDTDFDIDGTRIKLRIYTPSNGATAPRRGLLYFHGGGFVLGNLSSQDATCRQLCVESDSVVVSVHYRRAPEHPFPAAANDAIAAFGWLRENSASLGVDTQRLYVSGDSAGGNLAAVVALEQRENLAGQILIYPVTHHADYGTDSYQTRGTGHLLTRDMMEWFWKLYLTDSNPPQSGVFSHPLATPLARTDLDGLPSALVVIAGLDPLRDEGVEYAAAMQSAGVPVKTSEYPDAEHGFVGTGGPGADNDRAIAEIAEWLRANET